MRIRQRILIALCGIILTAGAANAQVVIHAGPPPPVIVERPGPPLHAGWVWVSGYYRWNGARYVWVPGTLGQSAAAGGCVDSRPLGCSPRRLCLRRRILALDKVPAAFRKRKPQEPRHHH